MDGLEDLLCSKEDRFCLHATGLGHVTIDPFLIILEKDANEAAAVSPLPRPGGKMQCESIEFSASGCLRLSYSDWSSPLVVVAKANGKIRLTRNYKRVNQKSVIPVLPLPTVADLLSGLDAAKFFSAIDLILRGLSRTQSQGRTGKFSA